MDDSILKMTTTFMQCAECFKNPRVPGLSPLWPPRGWAGQWSLKPPTVLMVSLNPGHPLMLAPKHGPRWNETEILDRHGLDFRPGVEEQEVVSRRRTNVTFEAARDVLDICWRSYTDPTTAHDHLFHRRSVAYARACLWLLGVDDDWRDHCWFTDVVKCSTIVETKTPLPRLAISNCRRHLVAEIEMVRPSVVAVLGQTALEPAQLALNEAKLPAPTIQLLHPSRWRQLTSKRQAKSFRGFPAIDGRSPDSQEFLRWLESLQAELRG